jgi:hypothetical protein
MPLTSSWLMKKAETLSAFILAQFFAKTNSSGLKVHAQKDDVHWTKKCKVVKSMAVRRFVIQ